MSKLVDKFNHYLNHSRPLKRFSDGLFIIAIAISGFTLLLTQYEKSKLPPGVCPIQQRTELYYLSIGLLLVAVVFSLFDGKNKKES